MNIQHRSILTVLSLAAIFAPRASVSAQSVGTIVVAHGGDSIWNSVVRESVAMLRLSGPVEISFLMGPEASATRFQDAVGRLVAKGAKEIVAVPLLVSSHSGHFEQIRYLARLTDTLDVDMQHHLHHAGIERAPASVQIRVTRALDESSELAKALTDRASAFEPKPQGKALMLVGHGPNSAEDYAAWMRNLRVVVDSVRRWSGFHDVRVELVREDAPAEVRAEAVQRLRELISLQAAVTKGTVTVVSILISRGGISRSRILKDLEGLPIRYSGEPLLPHPAMAAWIGRRVTEK